MSRNEQVFFHEEQYFRQPWLWAALVLPMAVTAVVVLWQVWSGWPGGKLPAWTKQLVVTEAVLLAVIFWLYKMRLVTEVRADELSLHFQWLWRRRAIPFAEIQSYHVVTYRPVAEYGGWGIRYGAAGDKAYNVSGDRGVRLEFADGGRLLVGSQRPEELARALDVATRADATPPARTYGWSGEGD